LTVPTPLVDARQVTRTFDNGAVTALSGVSVAIGEGDFVSIMGPSGCGKSSLLNLIGALDTPSSGEIRFAGQDLRQIRDLARFRAQSIGFVFQSFHLLPTLTALENVQVPMLETSLGRAARRSRAVELLHAVGLDHRIDHLPTKLSGGERQRVAIARSLANTPRLLLADEPTGNLDSASSQVVLELLTRIHRERGMTVITVTHDNGVAAAAGRIIRMLDGRVVADNTNAPARSE
jgi:ABC-type lipoprotein export system ATPase subunit